jgi:diguanylate cyclase (GGDEF)-like protein
VGAAADEAAAAAAAASSRDRTRSGLIIVFLVTSVLGIALVVWLIRSVVSRARRYSSFAVRVSAGGVGERLDASGWDELADLGRSLDALVSQHEHERAYRHSQGTFVDAMQVTESEEEAHQLIKRHLERSIAASTVVVLNRNNSHDRLESRTPLEPGSSLELCLEGAVPRSCLAVRFGQRHERGFGFDPLLRCTVCGETAESTVCDPLLVSGEVIGSVLVGHGIPLTSRDDMRIRDSVTQAAPVLANLRNLAIAELRAATDALTGLPNKRAVRDTMKRMVAQATRAETSLAVAFLDLDHFKQINDTYGHERGDEALAAVAEVMRETLRESDFVGRYGGEEFLLLLPDTDAAAAHATAAAVRTAIAQVSLPGVDRPITASVGIAILPTDSIDTETLVRSADRALYAAKSNGRDRIEFAGASPAIQRAPKNRAA